MANNLLALQGNQICIWTKLVVLVIILLAILFNTGKRTKIITSLIAIPFFVLLTNALIQQDNIYNTTLNQDSIQITRFAEAQLGPKLLTVDVQGPSQSGSYMDITVVMKGKPYPSRKKLWVNVRNHVILVRWTSIRY